MTRKWSFKKHPKRKCLLQGELYLGFETARRCSWSCRVVL